MLTEYIVSLWAAVSFSLYFIVVTRMPAKIALLNRKPFNCEVCLPFWLFAAFLPFAIYRYNGVLWLAALASACTAGIITVKLTQWIRT